MRLYRVTCAKCQHDSAVRPADWRSLPPAARVCRAPIVARTYHTDPDGPAGAWTDTRDECGGRLFVTTRTGRTLV